MKRKTIIISAVVGLVVLACLVGAAFLMLPRLSYAMQAFVQGAPAQDSVPSHGAGYGPGMGRGMMGGGGPGAFGTPVAPGSYATPVAPGSYATPSAGTNSSGVSSTPVVPGGHTAPSGGTGGLVAVTADGKPIPASSDAPKLPENTAAQKVGNLNVTLALTPYPPASFQNANFDLTLTDDKGQAVTDAQISLDLTMPGMWMPPSKPNAQAVGNGKYQAAGRWTMRGLWQIEVIIQRGSVKQSAFFTVGL